MWTWTDFQDRLWYAGKTDTNDRSAPCICIALFHAVERDTHLSEFGFYKNERYAFLRDKSERNDQNHTHESYDKEFTWLRKFFPCDTKTMTIYDTRDGDTRNKGHKWRMFQLHFALYDFRVVPKRLNLVDKNINKSVKLILLLFKCTFWYNRKL